MRLPFATLLMAAATVTAQAGVFFSVSIAPPALPVYAQPVCPGDGYLWTPGYWAYGPAGYYWVPGTWVLAPATGLLWTPGYWGWGGAAYIWHAGYWGPHVGFYGGINYGFGYFGRGFEGGVWEGGRFRYNTAVMRVDVTRVHNVYNKTVIVNNNVRTSFNGPRGVNVQASQHEMAAARERHLEATAAQTAHESRAASAHQASARQGAAPHNTPQAQNTARSFAGNNQPHSQPAHNQPAQTQQAHAQPAHNSAPHAESHGGAGGHPAEHRR
jgi:hypothetical protein